MKKVLITGGAGFIGTHLSQSLLEQGYGVIVLDNLSPQIHGADYTFPEREGIRFIKGDVRNKADWEEALKEANIVVHYAAETGTGQSMYEVHRYIEHNISGTGLLLDALVNTQHNVEKVIVASSRAIYGEGKYACDQHGVQYPPSRKDKDLAAGNFEPRCPVCDKPLQVLPTDEDSKLHPSSVYGITKLSQEQLVLNVCQSIGIPALAFRYQNVYGPGQSLKNPYTGILSIFSTLIRSGGKRINIFEDGEETRDFVYVGDVVKATMLGIESEAVSHEVYNVGSGVATTVLEVAEQLRTLYAADTEIEVTGNYRIGDIRHNVASLEKISADLGFHPEVSFSEGIRKFAAWVQQQEEVQGGSYEESIRQMKQKGLMK